MSWRAVLGHRCDGLRQVRPGQVQRACRGGEHRVVPPVHARQVRDTPGDALLHRLPRRQVPRRVTVDDGGRLHLLPRRPELGRPRRGDLLVVP